jgi:hypothetical protein
MDINEINEISDAFLEAWVDFFGAPMYLVPFDLDASSAVVDEYSTTYNEPKQYKYKYDAKLLFHGALKDQESLDKEGALGFKLQTELAIIFISKELADKGVSQIPMSSIIEFTDNSGSVKYYKIIDVVYRVQLTNHRIFTKMKVVELTDVERGAV